MRGVPVLVAALVAGILQSRAAEACQSTSPTVGQPWTGKPGITRTVSEIMAEEAAASRSSEPKPPRRRLRSDRSALPQAIGAPAVFQWPPRTAASAALVHAPALPQVAGVNFLGAQSSESIYIPPDSMGAVGPTQFLVAVNGRIKLFTKAGVLDPVNVLNVSLDTFFSSVSAGSSVSDPRVRFDRLSQRWFLTCINVASVNLVLIAVSSSATITDASSFTFFSFQHDLVGPTPNSDTNGFADYDTLGIDQNALYIGVNIFNTAGTVFKGTTGFVVRKTSVTSGGPIVVTAFRQLATAAGAGPYTPQGVDNDDPAATQGYFIGVDNVLHGKLQLRRVSTPGGTPTISANLPLTVPATSEPIGVDALGSNTPLDGLDSRLIMAQIQNNTLWTVHGINVDSTGIATGAGGTTGRNGARWYAIDNLAVAPNLAQSGTLFDNTVVSFGTARHTWMPSLAVSGQNHMVLGHSYAADSNSASTQLRPSVGAGGRLSTDPLGTTQATTILTLGAGDYNVQGPPDPVQRWGDFSFTSVDPMDNMTMWTVQEYCNAFNSWGVRVVQLKAPPPATPNGASPPVGSQGTASLSVTVTGASVAGSGFYDPGVAFPNHLSASVTGGVIVNSATYNSPTQVTLDLDIPVGAVLGPQDITITNPDGQALTLSSGFTVTTGPTAYVTAVNSTSVDGTYGVGTVIPIKVSFSASVTVTGTPQLTLETGAANAVVNYTSGSGTGTLTFNYTVAAGHVSADLDYVSPLALTLNGGTIKDAGAVDATLTLPGPGLLGSLGANRNLVIDTQPPDTTITFAPASVSNTSTAVFIFSSTESAGATFEVKLDGAGFVSNSTTTTITYPGLADGSHTFQVRALDTAVPANVDATPAMFTWTIDTVPPVASFTSKPRDPSGDPTPTFKFTSNEAGSTFEYRVDGGAWVSTGTTTTVTVIPKLALGLHTFEVRATDVAGNVGTPALYSWTIKKASGGGGGCGLLGAEAVALLLLRRRIAGRRR